MNILLLVLAVVWAVAFVVYDREVVQKKTFHKKPKKILATIVAPIVILFLAIYTTSAFVVASRTRHAVVNDPEMLIAAMENLENIQRERETKLARDALKNIRPDDHLHAPIGGNPEGRIVIYEFFDFNCGFCKRGHAALVEVLNTETDVKHVMKNLPIFPVSQIPARALIASRHQGKAEEFSNLLYETSLVPEAGERTTEREMNEKIRAIVFGVAQRAGLDVEQLKKDMESPAVEEELLRTRQLAEKLGIQGTPAFVIGDQLFRGYIDASQIKSAVERARKKR